jgi:hypothetical protein
MPYMHYIPARLGSNVTECQSRLAVKSIGYTQVALPVPQPPFLREKAALADLLWSADWDG